jgi:hypothetical protein
MPTINKDLSISSSTLKNAYYAHYAKGFPADPNMHYRFEVDRQILNDFIGKK